MLGKRAMAFMDYLDELDDEWNEGLDLLDGDLTANSNNYNALQAELHRMRECTDNLDQFREAENQEETSTREKILQSIKDDDQRLIHELDAELSMDDPEQMRAIQLALAIEPESDEDDVDKVVGQRREKRRRVRQPYSIAREQKQTDWLKKSFGWENEDFREFYRVSKNTFWKLVQILGPNLVFQSTGRKKQRPVAHQLAVFLLHYGNLGASAKYPKGLTSIREGTVLLYCRRVICAIREFGLTCVGWPTEERKEVIKAGFKAKCRLDNIIGALDGTLLRLGSKPRIEGDSYISRKGTPAVMVQVITDHKGRIILFQCGLPGSKNNMYVWKQSIVYKKRTKLFKPGEFLLADGGYPPSPFVLIPFSRPERLTDGARKHIFNSCISSARVSIKRTFGRLKSQFPSLHWLGAVEDMKDLYHAIEALLILHNMCYDLHDQADGFVDNFTQLRMDNGKEVYDYVAQESEASDIDEPNTELDKDIRQAGLRFRNECLDKLCPT